MRVDIKAAFWIVVWMTALGVFAAVFAGANDDRILVAIFAIALFLTAVLYFASGYRYRRTHTPEERAALATQSQLRRDRIKFARVATTYKRKVLHTGAQARAVITAVDDLHIVEERDDRLIYLELAVTVDAEPSYAVRTGEYLGDVSVGRNSYTWSLSSVPVGRELVVGVDLTDRQRVAVDWKKSAQLGTAPGSAAELLASGQRVRGVLKSFRATGKTPRSMGMMSSRPEFVDYPIYALVVELRFPNRAWEAGRNEQPIPPTEVPNLSIGRELNCAVDAAGPHRWSVDWS